jgi:hypothetical protein
VISILRRISKSQSPGKTMRKLICILFFAFLNVVPASLAQTLRRHSTVDDLNGKGFSMYTNFEQTHDSSSNWSSVIDESVSYDFNKVFAMGVGVPVYLSYNQVSTSTPTGTTTPIQTLTPAYNSIGDVRLALKFSSPTPMVRYVATITGTAPTGDTASGISTGRATADFNNHIEFDLGPVTPLMELGIANTNALIDMVKRPYSTLGALSHFKGGISLPVMKAVDIEFAGYENLPLGTQKLYSHLLGGGSVNSGPGNLTSGSGKGSASKIYQQIASAVGTGFDEDNGFATGLNANFGKRLDLAFTYDHSVRQQLNTYAFSVGFRLGRVRGK